MKWQSNLCVGFWKCYHLPIVVSFLYMQDHFGESTNSLNNKRTIAFFLAFLTSLVPHEPAEYLKVNRKSFKNIWYVIKVFFSRCVNPCYAGLQYQIDWRTGYSVSKIGMLSIIPTVKIPFHFGSLRSHNIASCVWTPNQSDWSPHHTAMQSPIMSIGRVAFEL